MSKKRRLSANERKDILIKLDFVFARIHDDFEGAVELAEQLGQKKLLDDIRIAQYTFKQNIDFPDPDRKE